MPASPLGSTITLSGAWNLSELVGIAGVTRVQAPGLRYFLDQYTLSGVKLKITGTGAVSRNQKLIFTGQGASDGVLDIDGGTLTIDQPYTLNAFTYSLPQEALVFALSSDGIWNTKVLWVRNAGKLICRNALIRIPHSIWFEQNTSGQVLIENSVIDKTGSVGDIQTNHGGSGNNNTVIRNSVILCDGQSGLTFRNGTAPTIENVAVYQARDAWNNESGSYKVVRGLVPDTGNLADIAQWNNITVAVNPQKGSQFKWGGHLENSSNNTGALAVYQEVFGSIKTAAGAVVAGAVRYVTDTAAAADPAQASVPTQIGALINPAVRRVYIQTSNGSGTFAQQDILIGTGLRTTGGLQIAGGNSNRIRPRGKNTTASVDATDDVYEYTDLAYDFLPQTNPVTLKSGNGSAVNIVSPALADTNVTLSEAAATALTTVAHLDNLYDVAKLWKTRPVQANIEYLTPAVQPFFGAGDVLKTTLNIVIDGAAVVPFAINTATNTATVKSLALAPGTKFKTLQTTGTLTLVSGGTITAPFFDAANAGVINVTGLAPSDTAEMRRASDNSLIATRTGPGAFSVSPANVGASVYFRRLVGTELVMSTITAPVALNAGVNTDVPLFAGAQVQVAQAARIDLLPTAAEVWANPTRTLNGALFE